MTVILRPTKGILPKGLLTEEGEEDNFEGDDDDERGIFSTVTNAPVGLTKVGKIRETVSVSE